MLLILFLITVFALFLFGYLYKGLSQTWLWTGLAIAIVILILLWCADLESSELGQTVSTDISTVSYSPKVLTKRSEIFSPIGTPTQIEYNLPQIKRGFRKTDQSILSL